MNWLKILYEFERLIFQLTVLVLLAPKTLFKIAVNPKWLLNYLAIESKKDPEQRFDEYVSPIIYWVIFCVLLLTAHVLIAEFIDKVLDAALVFLKPRPIPSWTDINFDISRLGQAIILSLWYPLVFAAVPVVWITKNLSRRTMEIPFYLQCYAFGTFVTLYTIIEIPLLIIGVGGFSGRGILRLNYLALGVSCGWMVWFQNVFLTNESIKIASRIIIIFLSGFISTVLLYGTILVVKDLPNSLLTLFRH
jgi:hypothetical protein